MVKNPLATAGDLREGVQSFGQKEALEEGLATHSSILAWKTSRTEKPGGLQSKGRHN